MISSDGSFILCDSAAAVGLALTQSRLSCWIHVDDQGAAKAPRLALHFAHAGAVHFAISGIEASYVHDEIDDALLAAGFEIATTWHEEPLKEVAWDFANIDFVSGGPSTKFVVVTGPSESSEMNRIAELARYLAEAMHE